MQLPKGRYCWQGCKSKSWYGHLLQGIISNTKYLKICVEISNCSFFVGVGVVIKTNLERLKMLALVVPKVVISNFNIATEWHIWVEPLRVNLDIRM